MNLTTWCFQDGTEVQVAIASDLHMYALFVSWRLKLLVARRQLAHEDRDALGRRDSARHQRAAGKVASSGDVRGR